MQEGSTGSGPSQETFDDVLPRSERLLEYLEAVLALRERPIRDLYQYKEKVWWFKDLPRDPACRLHEDDGAWLRLSKVLVPDPPAIPPDLAPHVTPGPSADDPPVIRPTAYEADEEGFPGTPASAHTNALQEQLDGWIASIWEPWSLATDAARGARQLYREIYDLYLRLQRDEASLEFIWGHGLLAWQVEHEVVRHPVLTTRMSIAFDEATGDLVVAADEETQIELEFLQGLDVGGMPFLIDLQRRFAELPSDPWIAEEAIRLYEDFVTRLPVAGLVGEGLDSEAPSSTPRLTPTSMFFVRRRKTMFRAFLAALRERLGPNGSLTGPLASVVSSTPSLLLMPDDQALIEDWSSVGEELLLPLPTNAEQEQIVLRLATHRGVTVQGPPGTGKTHTIANLVCHLVAHGKRVLVTSHKEQALAVLREKIPAEIRDLSVAVLGSTRHSQAQLEQSVQSIYSNAVGIDLVQKTRELEELRTQLRAARADVARLRTELGVVRESENLMYQLGEEELTPSEVGRWLAERSETHGFISDAIEPQTPCPLSAQELVEFYELTQSIEDGDVEASRQVLPSSAEFVRGSELATKAARRTEILAALEQLQLDDDVLDKVRTSGADNLKAIAGELRRFGQRLVPLEEPWLIRLRMEIQPESLWRQAWLENREAIQRGLQDIAVWRSDLSGRRITLPTIGVPTTELIKTLEELRTRRLQGKTVSKLFHKRLFEASQTCKVDGEFLKDAQSTQLVLTESRLRRRRQELLRRFNDEADRIGAPPVEDGANTDFELATRMASLREAFDWVEGEPTLRTILEEYFPNEHREPTSGYLVRCAEQVEGAEQLFELEDIDQSATQTKARIEEALVDPASSYLWAQLQEALDRSDWASWDASFVEARRLQLLRPDVERMQGLSEQLSVVAPVWARLIQSSDGDEQVCGPLAETEQAWTFAAADTWLKALIARGDVVQLQRRLENSLSEVSRLSVRTTAASAWVSLATSLTDEQRSSLVAWVNSLKKVGKGTGKYANRWRAVAQKEMRGAVGAVPVWIMPTYRVVESVDPSVLDAFDVLIVDEASQSDVISIALLGIARKAVIVGDDKQISPQSFMNQGSVHQLQEQYLKDIPSSDLLDVTSSLYDTAKRVFPGVVMLREHFRCLPEIIQFSNDLSYDGRILPLRERPPELADWEPVIDRHVVEGYRDAGTQTNLPEAEALVRQVIELCHDPRYQDKSMGVISLLGSEQARLIEERLIGELGEREFEHRRLRSGDAYHFQGDERDIMFLSLVVAASDATRGVMTKESDRQRINVAASRARDQMWVFRSLAPADLNPGDFRGELIRYAMDPHRVVEEYQDLADLCESDFERDVLRKILSRGFSVSVQHRVGAYRIDMVVKGMRNRLAIECDGDAFHGPEQWDADRRRQEVLERLGWKFFRVRGSAFYRNQEAALESLWDRLEELGIRPWVEEAPKTRSDSDQVRTWPSPETVPAIASEPKTQNPHRPSTNMPLNAPGQDEEADTASEGAIGFDEWRTHPEPATRGEARSLDSELRPENELTLDDESAYRGSEPPSTGESPFPRDRSFETVTVPDPMRDDIPNDRDSGISPDENRRIIGIGVDLAKSIEELPLGQLALQIALLVKEKQQVSDAELASAFAVRFDVSVPKGRERLLSKFAWSAKGHSFIDRKAEKWVPGRKEPSEVKEFGNWTLNALIERAVEIVPTCSDGDQAFERLLGEVHPDAGRVPKILMSVCGTALNTAARRLKRAP